MEDDLRKLQEIIHKLEITNLSTFYIKQLVEVNSINSNLINQIISYLRITDEHGFNEIEKYKINYSFFKGDNQKIASIREQIEKDNRRMVRAKKQDDFLEFCRYAWLQLEPVISFLLKSRYNYKKDDFNKACGIFEKKNKDNEKFKNNFIEVNKLKDIDKMMEKMWEKSKIELSFIVVCNNKEDIYQAKQIDEYKRVIKSEKRDKYILILSLYELRNIASHSNEELSLEDRIDRIKYEPTKDKVKNLYFHKDYERVKEAVEWFIYTMYTWIPSEAKK